MHTAKDAPRARPMQKKIHGSFWRQGVVQHVTHGWAELGIALVQHAVQTPTQLVPDVPTCVAVSDAVLAALFAASDALFAASVAVFTTASLAWVRASAALLARSLAVSMAVSLLGLSDVRTSMWTKSVGSRRDLQGIQQQQQGAATGAEQRQQTSARGVGENRVGAYRALWHAAAAGAHVARHKLEPRKLRL